MLDAIPAAGYVVANNEAIWGYGATADDAWAMFRRDMRSAGVEILEDGQDMPEDGGSYTRGGDYRTLAASRALLDLVENRGGNIAWGSRLGVAVTRDEADA